MPIIPAPLRAYIGLVATTVETAQYLIRRAPELPVEAVGNTMQLSMKVQQRYQEMVARGDELLSSLIGAPAQPPAWATFDDDESVPPSEEVTTDDSAAEFTAGLDDDASPAPIFDETPASGAVFDDDLDLDADVDITPAVTHGDPLLAETPVMALPVKKPGRRNAGGARRRVATAPAGPPTGTDSDAASSFDSAADSTADADPDFTHTSASGSASSDATESTDLTGTAMPAPANVDITDAMPIEAVLAELADATPADTTPADTILADTTPADTIAAIPSARKTPTRRSAARRPRTGVGSAADTAAVPASDPAVAQPAEPVDAAVDLGPSSA